VRASREELIRVLIPPVATVILVLAFFTIFDRWHKLQDPINSAATIVLAGVGFAIGVGLDRMRLQRARRSVTGGGATPQA
jgi:hypothetical protein